MRRPRGKTGGGEYFTAGRAEQLKTVWIFSFSLSTFMPTSRQKNSTESLSFAQLIRGLGHAR